MNVTGKTGQISRAKSMHRQACGSVHDRYPLIGLARAHHQNKRGHPMTFAAMPYLVPLLARLPDMDGADFCKAPQTGLSEALIMLMLYNAGWRDRICANVMPTSGISNRFVSQRIDPLLHRVPAYAERTPGGEWGDDSGKGKGNLKTKRFGPLGSLLFMYSKTESDMVEFSADTIVIDEYDLCDMRQMEHISGRLLESDHPQFFRVSNPWHPSAGVSRLWKEGTRSRWWHKCPRCNEYQFLDWFKNIAEQDASGQWVPRDKARITDTTGDIRPVCIRCKRPWERTHEGSVWVEEVRDRKESFHLSRMDVLASKRRLQPIRNHFFGDEGWIKAQGDTGRLVAFYMRVLGWAYEPEGSRITQTMLDRAMLNQPEMDHHGSDKYEDQTVVMGVDVGSLLNVSISVIEQHPKDPDATLRRAVRVCTVPRFEDLHDLVKAYRVGTIVIDADPETRKSKEIRDYYREADEDCVVWLCRFHPTSRVGSDAFGLKLNYDEQLVTVDRTQLLDTTMGEIAQGTRVFPCDADMALGFCDQMRAPVAFETSVPSC